MKAHLPKQTILVILLLALHASLCLHTAWSKTITHDEIWHLPIGIGILRGQDLSIATTGSPAIAANPPLTRIWAAIPAYLADVRTPDWESDHAAWGRKFVSQTDWHRWYFAGRCVNICLSLLTALVVYQLSRSLWGEQAALLSLLLYSTSPNLIAHASVVTPDFGFALGFLFTISFSIRHAASQQWHYSIILGVFLGATLLTKFTAVLLVPLVPLILWINRGKSRVSKILLNCLVVGVTALLVVNGVYLFQGSYSSFGSFHFQSSTLSAWKEIAWLAAVPVPLPAEYILSLDLQRYVMEQQHPVFLDGEWSFTGFRVYFVKALLYKVPLVTLVLAASAGMLCLKKKPILSARRNMISLLLPAILLVAAASMTKLQLGIRYILPALCLLMVLSGRWGLTWQSWNKPLRVLAAVTFVAVTFGPLQGHPHHLTYFNEYAGGAIGGRQHLIDSNLDWGQDLHLVKEYIEANQIEDVSLAYFGTFAPAELGIEYELPSAETLEPGWHFISVNYVMGRPHAVIDQQGEVRHLNFAEYAHYRQFEPVTCLGNSIDVYHIKEAEISGHSN